MPILTIANREICCKGGVSPSTSDLEGFGNKDLVPCKMIPIDVPLRSKAHSFEYPTIRLKTNWDKLLCRFRTCLCCIRPRNDASVL